MTPLPMARLCYLLQSSLCLALTELSQQRAVERAEVEEAVGEVERLQEDVRLALLRNASHKRSAGDVGVPGSLNFQA